MKKPLTISLPLQFFAEGGESATGDTAPTAPNAQTETPPQSTENGVQESKTFSQAELNAMMTREKEQGKRAILKELGVEDVKSAKDGLARYREFLESQKSELQKAQEAANSAGKEKDDLARQLEEANMRLSVLSAGCIPEKASDICVLAQSRTSDTVTFDDAVKLVKKEYPSLFGQTAESKGTGGNLNPNRKGLEPKEGLGARLAAGKAPGKNPYFSN